MSADLSKLPPAPWDWDADIDCAVYSTIDLPGFVVFVSKVDDELCPVCDEETSAVCEFSSLARNAFDGDPEALAWWEANRRRRENL